MQKSKLFTNGTLLVFTAILLGAFGAHGLKSYIHDEHLLADFHLAAQYQIYHGLALILLGLWGEREETRRTKKIALALYAGIFFFCGSLYLLAITGVRNFGAITPLGGLCFLAAWLLWALETRRRN